jgi:malonate decarboxylase alpha subunit
MFIGSTLQIDRDGNSSTVTSGRISGFGGAPNLGYSPHGRRHSSPAWLDLAETPGGRGRKLVVQIVETFGDRGLPHFVESLDAVQVGKDAGLDTTPVMIYGDDITHVVTEQGVAYLYKCRDLEERRQAVAWAAGFTELGRSRDRRRDAELHRAGIVAAPEDLGVRRTDARRSLLAARSIEELVEWSGGLYRPPSRFRSW